MCGEDLSPGDGLALRCPSGHSHDTNKRGWFTALDTSRGISGDPRELLEARRDLLGTGIYSPIADAITELLPEEPLDVVDAGTGTGWYLAQLQRSGRVREALALDASSAAVAMSVSGTGAAGLVADTWQPLPVRSARSDLVLCVFAPRNASEFSRVLRPTGTLVVVTPGTTHLQELRAAGLVMDMQEDKDARLADTLSGHFLAAGREEVRYETHVDSDTGRLLADMGPSGHHVPRGGWSGGAVTVDVTVSSWRPAAP